MIKCKCLNSEGKYINEYAYTLSEYPFDDLKKEFKKGYYIKPATFDIETTTIDSDTDIEVPYAFMYIWQFCLNEKVIFGRTWKEFKELINKLIEVLELDDTHKLVIYVHNLSFEFEFIRDFIEFDNVFATAPRKVLKASNEFIEFRCSYYLSNMNLAKFISNTPNAIHYKGVDDLDYRVIRTPSTILTEKEYGYCFNDVKGLEEAILYLLKEDTLKSIPLTSTGYVRRDCRKAMKSGINKRKNRYQFRNLALDSDEFILLQECFRGGNTASNRKHCNKLLHNVGSYDISSSYPYVMIACDFPIDKFMMYTLSDIDDLEKVTNKYCTIGRYCFTNIKLKKDIPIPYLAMAKCETVNAKVFNGRVLKADVVKISLTNVDFLIIKDMYEYDEVFIKDFYIARKGKLPVELRQQIIKYYEKKTTLKGDDEHYYEYIKSKNKLNSIFGMTVTSPVREEIEIVDGVWIKKDNINIEEKLNKYYSSFNNFLSYQWGVFVTANARYRLQQGLNLVGNDVVYCDTDSIKYINHHDKDFEYLNSLISDTVTFSTNGKFYPMGIWVSENKEKGFEYDEFKTLGAKKYAYKVGDKLGVTVSGLSKKLGAKELEKGKGLLDFHNGKVFLNSGRTIAYFNNEPIHYIKINNDIIETGSNIAIIDTTYTLGISDTMLDIISDEEAENTI